MKLLRRAYPIVVFVATGPLVACGDPAIFDRVGPRSDAASSAEWPRLADTPATPPVGVFTAEAPDPARGDALQIEAAVAAEEAERRRVAVSGPVE